MQEIELVELGVFHQDMFGFQSSNLLMSRADMAIETDTRTGQPSQKKKHVRKAWEKHEKEWKRTIVINYKVMKKRHALRPLHFSWHISCPLPFTDLRSEVLKSSMTTARGDAIRRPYIRWLRGSDSDLWLFNAIHIPSYSLLNRELRS